MLKPVVKVGARYVDAHSLIGEWIEARDVTAQDWPFGNMYIVAQSIAPSCTMCGRTTQNREVCIRTPLQCFANLFVLRQRRYALCRRRAHQGEIAVQGRGCGRDLFLQVPPDLLMFLRCEGYYLWVGQYIGAVGEQGALVIDNAPAPCRVVIKRQIHHP